MIEFLQHHGAPLVFAAIFLDQLGLPIPSAPLLLTLGALAGRGSIGTGSTLLVATAASLCADLAWFQVGRWRGRRVLGFLCRIALEPDTCVSKTENAYTRYGVKSLLVAKFVPGLDTAAPPLAGMLGVGLVPFILWSAAGGLLWLVTFGSLGYLFSDRLAELVVATEQYGGLLGYLVAGLFAGYIGWKLFQRHRVLRRLRMDRITPQEVHRRIVAGEPLAIVDVRPPASIQTLPYTIAGARFVTYEELDLRHDEIPRDRDVVLYCA